MLVFLTPAPTTHIHRTWTARTPRTPTIRNVNFSKPLDRFDVLDFVIRNCAAFKARRVPSRCYLHLELGLCPWRAPPLVGRRGDASNPAGGCSSPTCLCGQSTAGIRCSGVLLPFLPAFSKVVLSFLPPEPVYATVGVFTVVQHDTAILRTATSDIA